MSGNYEKVGKERLLQIAKNLALEGFTLPKILWVKRNEPEIYRQSENLVLPKDYVRYRLTGQLHMEYSDAAGTLLLDITEKEWSEEICRLLDIPVGLCPPLVESHEEVGTITPEISKVTGLSTKTRVFAGGADNACGAIGAGILQDGKSMVSIGTSGVFLSYEADGNKNFGGKVHYFNHGAPDAYYTMGVTLAAGYSLSWFKDVFAKRPDLTNCWRRWPGCRSVPKNGLLFTPYIVGERTPHADANIRGSSIGMDSSHQMKHFVRAVLEGITFSFNESVEIFRENGTRIDTIVSIGGGAKVYRSLAANAGGHFNARRIVKLSSEQGPGMGAAMLAAYGCGWFDSLQECSDRFLRVDKFMIPSRKTSRNTEACSICTERFIRPRLR